MKINFKEPKEPLLVLNNFFKTKERERLGFWDSEGNVQWFTDDFGNYNSQLTIDTLLTKVYLRYNYIKNKIKSTFLIMILIKVKHVLYRLVSHT